MNERRAPEAVELAALHAAATDAESLLAKRMRLHPTDFAAMVHITSPGEPIGPRELSGRLGITPGAATELVDRLVAAGLVERERDLADRRRVRLMPTGSAREDVRAQLTSLSDELDHVAFEFDADERRTIQAYLARAVQAYRAFAADD